MPDPGEIFEFGPFRLDVRERMLWRGGTPVALQPRVFHTLELLVRRAGRLVRKDELLRELWPDTHVSEANLTQNVWLLRRALGEEAGGPAYIETVPRAGYRFVAPVARTAASPASPPAIPGVPTVLGSEPPASVRSRRVWAVLLALSALALGLAASYPLRQRVRQAPVPASLPERPARPAIAALELANLSGDPEVGWLAVALPEMLAAELAASGEIRTLPGETVARNLALDPSRPLGGEELRRLGARLGVEYLLTGSYLVAGEKPERRVRVDLRLVDARSGETVATVSDTRSEAGLLALVSDGGMRLRKSLGLGPLTAAETSAWLAALPSDPEARSLYFEGLRKLRALDALAARRLFERVIAREPAFPLAHAALASAWISLGYDGKAREAARAAVDRSGSLSREGRLLVEAGYHQAARQWDEAIQRFQALFTFYPDEIEYGLRLASTLSLAGRGEEALRTVSRLRSLPAPRSADPRIDLVEAQAAQALGDLRRAIAASSSAAEKGRRQGSPRLVAGALAFQGNALRDLGETAAARAALEEALALSRATGDRFEEARDLHSLAHIVRIQGNVAEAEAMYHHTLELSREVGNQRAASMALGSLANLSFERGDLREALEAYGRVLAIKREVGDRKGEGIVLYNMAQAHHALGELAQAERRFLEALAIRRQAGEKMGVANSAYGLAMVRLARGDLASVPGLLRESEALCREVGDQAFLAATLAVWGDLRLLQGDLAGALGKYQEALRIQRAAGLESDAAESLSGLAEVLRESGRVGEAAEAAAQAVEGFRRAEDPEGEALARVTLAGCRVAQGRVAEARRTLDPLLRTGAGRQRIEIRLQAGLGAAEVEAAAGRPRQAGELLERTLREAEEAGLAPYVFEARLARLSLQGDPAGLAALAREAEARGLGLVAAKARNLLRESAISPARRAKKEEKEISL